MSKNKVTEQEAPARSEPIDVTPEDGHSLALAAAFDGLYHLFGVRVEKWLVTVDGIFASAVTCYGQFDLNQIITDVSRNVRRAQLWPTINWIMNGYEPEPFVNSQAITTFMTQYFKGAEAEGTSRSPKYVLDAAKEYKVRTGTAVSRGPKPKTINLKNLTDVNVEQILAAGVSKEQLEGFLAKMAEAANQTAPAAEAVTA